MRPRKTTAPAISRKVRRLFDAICSYTSAGEVDLRGAPRRVLDLEERTLREAEGSGDEHRGERSDERVQPHHLVVVELPRIRDLRLGARQLLLEREEALVGLQVRVVLDHREELPQPAGDLV